MYHLKDGYHNPVLSSKFPYPPSSGRILRATPVTGQSGSSRTGDTVDPADIARGNVRPDHDITVAVQRLKHQIVHALGTQFRVHSREGQRSRAGTLIAIGESGQSGNTNARDVHMQVSFDRRVRAVCSVRIPCVRSSSLRLNRYGKPHRNCCMSPYRADYITILKSLSSGPPPFRIA